MEYALETGRGQATIANDFASFDRLSALIDEASNEAALVSQTNPDAAIRAAGEACIQQVSSFATKMELSRPIYVRLEGIPLAGLDAETAWVLGRRLLRYRLAGVTQDATARDHIADLHRRIVATGLVFDGNIRDAPYALVATPADLAGLPADFVRAHPVASDGNIHIVGESDTYTVMIYADREAVRRAAYLARANRAWPQNEPVLRELLSQRAGLATALGKPDFASVVLADRMVGSPEQVQVFLDKMDAATLQAAAGDRTELLARWRRFDPTATSVAIWNGGYIARLLRLERYTVDDAEVRRYFTFDKTRRGVFKLAHDLFGATFRPWRTPVWDPSVTAWEVYSGKRLVGRFFLDPHPREGKFGRAATFPIREGVEGRVVPLVALVLNLPPSGALDHEDVRTFLHEFGHVLHALYSGHHRWAASSMGNVEADFIEAPSQLLEEWVWDYDTLATFASDAQNRPIPRDLVARMNRARAFQQGIDARNQLFRAAMSLDFYRTAPASLDFDKAMRFAMERYGAYPYEPTSHPWAAFGQFNNYTAGYYGYLWSEAIAIDLFTRFQRSGLRDRATALAYRSQILEPGASAPAATLVSRFLGRPSGFAAYQARLSGNATASK